MATWQQQIGPPRRWLGKGILILGSTLLALVLAEGALRVYFWTQGVGRADVHELLRLSQQAPEEVVDTQGVFGIVQPSPFPDVVYELRPNLRGRFRGRPFSTNSFGLRGPEIDRQKPPGTLRIVGLGDSHMFGWGVGQEETYLALLEKGLRARGVQVETLNFSAPGYNTAIEAAIYERKARHFAPDLVVMHFVGNDLNLPHHLQPPRSFQPGRWYLVELLRGALAEKGLDGELELLPHNLRKVPEDLRHAARGRYAYMQGEEGYRRAMEALVSRTRKDGVAMLLLALGERELVARVAAEHGIAFLDAAPTFMEVLRAQGGETDREAWKAAFKIPGDGHPSVFAHRAYAETLLRELGLRGWFAGS